MLGRKRLKERIKNPTTLGVKPCKLHTEVFLITPRTKSPARSKFPNLSIVVSSIQSLRLCVPGEVLLGLIRRKGLMPFFFCVKILMVSK